MGADDVTDNDLGAMGIAQANPELFHEIDAAVAVELCLQELQSKEFEAVLFLSDALERATAAEADLDALLGDLSLKHPLPTDPIDSDAYSSRPSMVSRLHQDEVPSRAPPSPSSTALALPGSADPGSASSAAGRESAMFHGTSVTKRNDARRVLASYARVYIGAYHEKREVVDGIESRLASLLSRLQAARSLLALAGGRPFADDADGPSLEDILRDTRGPNRLASTRSMLMQIAPPAEDFGTRLSTLRVSSRALSRWTAQVNDWANEYVAKTNVAGTRLAQCLNTLAAIVTPVPRQQHQQHGQEPPTAAQDPLTRGHDLSAATWAIEHNLTEAVHGLEQALMGELDVLMDEEQVGESFPRTEVKEASRAAVYCLTDALGKIEMIKRAGERFAEELPELERWVDATEDAGHLITEALTLRDHHIEVEYDLAAAQNDFSKAERLGRGAATMALQDRIIGLRTATVKSLVAYENVASMVVTAAWNHYPELRSAVLPEIVRSIDSHGTLKVRSLTVYDVQRQTRVAGVNGANHDTYEASIDGVPCLLKRYPIIIDEPARRRLVAVQAGLLAKLAHPGLVTTSCVFFQEGPETSAFLETRGLEGAVTLREWLDTASPTPPQIHFVFLSILRALELHHANGLVHGHLTPETIMVLNGQPKLPAFDITLTPGERALSLQHQTQEKNLLGTLPYLAPEIFDPSLASAVPAASTRPDVAAELRLGPVPVWYTPLIDVYACGVMLLEAIFPGAVLWRGPGAGVQVPSGAEGSAWGSAVAVLHRMLARDRRERVSAREALASAYFARGGDIEAKIDEWRELRRVLGEDLAELRRNQAVLEDQAVRVKRARADVLTIEERSSRKPKSAGASGSASQLPYGSRSLALGESFYGDIAARKAAVASEQQELAIKQRAATQESLRIQAGLRQAAKMGEEIEILKEQEARLAGAIIRPPVYWQLGSISPAEPHRSKRIDVTDLLGARFQELMEETCKAQYIRHGAGSAGSFHRGYRVERVHRVENDALWREYARRRSTVTENGGPHPPTPTEITEGREWLRHDLLSDADANEVFLLHGAPPDTVFHIANGGFQDSLARSRSLFGNAVHFAENSSKADEACAPDSHGSCYMIMARVTLGTPFETPTAMAELTQPPTLRGHSDPLSLDRRCDSVLAVTTQTHPSSLLTKYREFMVYDKSLAYPEFIIQFARVK